MAKLNVYEVFREGNLEKRYEACDSHDPELRELMATLEQISDEYVVERFATFGDCQGCTK